MLQTVSTYTKSHRMALRLSCSKVWTTRRGVDLLIERSARATFSTPPPLEKKEKAKETAGTEPPQPSFLEKMRGGPRGALAPMPPMRQLVRAGMGCFAGVAGLTMAHHGLGEPDAAMVLGSMGATAVLVFGFPDAPFSQPRAVIGGHVLAAAIGSSAVLALPPEIAAPAAVSAATVTMLATRTVHPPAGGTALIAVAGGASVQALGVGLVVPAAFGACGMVGIAAVLHNIEPDPDRRYPKGGYW